MQLAKQDYYKALVSRDARFDGVFFNCVQSTGIYCRPICPTHAPKFAHCHFVATAAEAEKLGYRPCLRCRPELAPLTHSIDHSSAAMLRRHIEETLLSDETLAQAIRRYGVSERHMRRLFVAAFGVEPKQYLTTRRLLFAKQLLQDTNLPSRDVAYSAGFNTPDRLTITMRTVYGFTPERFRKEKLKQKPHYLSLRADYRPPLDWGSLLAILKDRATPFEAVEGNVYIRTVDGRRVSVHNDPRRHRLTIDLPVELSLQAHAIVSAVRRLFDLDADPLAIQRALGSDPWMANLIMQFPGVRIPGAWDGFELLLRVIIGQQISVAGATTVMRRLVDRIGGQPEVIAKSNPAAIAAIGMPLKRAETIHAVSVLVTSGQLDLEERRPELFYNRLVAVPGIGPWTAEYACLRILHWPDAFPAGDLGIRKALGVNGEKIPARQAEAQSQAWRPWRSYATLLLWKSIMNKGKGG